jgi:hypothetical protein
MSSNIEINLVGGELLGRDQRKRAIKREDQLTQEKQAQVEVDFNKGTIKNAVPMRGERGKTPLTSASPAARPTKRQLTNLAMFKIYLENSRVGISSIKQFPTVSWYDITPVPEAPDIIPTPTTPEGETFEFVYVGVQNRIQDPLYVLPAGRTAAVIVFVRNFIAFSERVSAFITYEESDFVWGTSYTYTTPQSNYREIDTVFTDVYATSFNDETGFSATELVVKGYTPPNIISQTLISHVDAQYDSWPHIEFGFYVQEAGHREIPAYDIYHVVYSLQESYQVLELVDLGGSTYRIADGAVTPHSEITATHFTKSVRLQLESDILSLFYEVNCYYVDENGSKEISCPPTINARALLLNPALRLETLHLPARPNMVTSLPQYESTFSGDIVYNLAPTSGSKQTVPNLINSFLDVGAKAFKTINPVHGENLYVDQHYIDYDPMYESLYPFDNQILLKTYGLVGTQQFSPYTFRTPAFFKYFQASLDLSDAATTQQYISCKTTFLADLNPPNKLIQPNLFKSQEGYLNFYSSNEFPESISSAIPEFGGAPVARIRDPNGMATQGPIICWDWNQPQLCTNQLKALGFTDQDLLPT